VNLRRKTVVTVISKIGDRRPKADACLVVIYGQSTGAKYTLKPGEYVVGRSSQAQLQIDHESVSRRHARIQLTDSGVVLSDLGSTNGTYVNDEPISERTLSHGDLLKVGRTILKYLSTDNIEAAYFEEIHRLSTVDGLTRALNAKAAREALGREYSRAARYGRPLSLLVFDIDQFGVMNQEYGHLAGDAVLAQLGKKLGRRVRREDIFARTGGGEFCVITPEVNKEGALLLSQRLIELVHSSSFGFDDVKIPLTLSVGVAAIEEMGDDVHDLQPTSTEHKKTEEIVSHDASSSRSSSGEFTGVDTRPSAEVPDRQQQAADLMLQLARRRMRQAAAGRSQTPVDGNRPLT
jgi:two-component system, cell cycle response regulator